MIKMGCNITINEIFSTLFQPIKKNAKSLSLQSLNTTFDIFAF